jgi:hypothetical protein
MPDRQHISRHRIPTSRIRMRQTRVLPRTLDQRVIIEPPPPDPDRHTPHQAAVRLRPRTRRAAPRPASAPPGPASPRTRARAPAPTPHSSHSRCRTAASSATAHTSSRSGRATTPATRPAHAAGQRQLAIVGDLPRRESMNAAAREPHRTLHLRRRRPVTDELEHRPGGIAGERAEDRAERGIVLGRGERSAGRRHGPGAK